MLDQSHTPVNSKLVEIKLACVHPASLISGQIHNVVAFVSNFPRPHDHRPSQGDAADNFSDAMATSVRIWIVLINISTVRTFVIPPDHVELAVSDYEALSP